MDWSTRFGHGFRTVAAVHLIGMVVSAASAQTGTLPSASQSSAGGPSAAYPSAPIDTAQTRLRPVGAPSAVDQYRSADRYRAAVPAQVAHPVSPESVRQVAWMQSPSDAQAMQQPTLPPGGIGLPGGAIPAAPAPVTAGPQGGYALPPSGALPVPLQAAPVGPITSPPPAVPPVSNVPLRNSAPPAGTGLPVNPNVGPMPRTTVPPISAQPNVLVPAPVVGIPRTSLPNSPVTAGPVSPPATVPSAGVPARSSDYAAIPAPTLDSGFATMSNCRNVTGPSSYRAAGFFGCAPGGPTYPASVTVPAAYTPPPAQIAPAIGLPPSAISPVTPVGAVSLAGSLPPVIPGNPGYRPLLSFGQENKPVQVGQGLLGQPVAYVPGEYVRNVLRYLSF